MSDNLRQSLHKAVNLCRDLDEEKAVLKEQAKKLASEVQYVKEMLDDFHKQDELEDRTPIILLEKALNDYRSRK